MPPRTQAYYDWLVTGLEILKEQGHIEVEYAGHVWDKLLRCHPKSMDIVRRISPDLEDLVSPMDYTCVTGRMEQGGKIMNFAVDIADAPFVFSLALLETVDVYFKYQCPIQFETEGFAINCAVRIPYHPDVFTFQSKIRPGMLGNPLGRSLSLKRNLRVLREWEAATRSPKDIRIYASFGLDTPPDARTPRTPLPAPYNYQSEPSLQARWGHKIHHPNIKRARIVEMLREMNHEGIDARMWRAKNPKLQGKYDTPEQYRQNLGRAMINMNLSGFRRSLPFRFMDTFLTGGLLATDNLAIRWYQPFDACEVFEMGELGYEPEENVNWEQVKQTLVALYEKTLNFQENAKAVRAAYEKKWAPQVFANYFVKECQNALEARIK